MLYKKHFVLAVFTILYSIHCIAQLQTAHWFMGRGIHFDFTQPEGEELQTFASNINAVECMPASISDEHGNLLFYSDGETIWGGNHQILKNGEGLYGSRYIHVMSSLNIIVPVFNNPGVYYLFTPSVVHGGLYWQENRSDTLVYYHVIDMNRNGGRGEVVEKNKALYHQSVTGLNATLHVDGTSVWLLAHKADGRLFAFLINECGIQEPVITDSGFRMEHLRGIDNYQNRSVLSPRGDILCLWFVNGILENFNFSLQHFNNSTGKFIKISDYLGRYDVRDIVITSNGKYGYVHSGIHFFRFRLPENLANIDDSFEIIPEYLSHDFRVQKIMSNYKGELLITSSEYVGNHLGVTDTRVIMGKKFYRIKDPEAEDLVFEEWQTVEWGWHSLIRYAPDGGRGNASAIGHPVFLSNFYDPDFVLPTPRVQPEASLAVEHTSCFLDEVQLFPSVQHYRQTDSLVISIRDTSGNMIYKDKYDTLHQVAVQLAPGSYEVSFTAWDQCLYDEDIQTLSLDSLPSVQIIHAQRNEDTIKTCPPVNVVLDAIGNWKELNWNTEATTSKTEVQEIGVYELTASTACGIAQDKVVVSTEKMFIPNIITPNGDQKNDTWVIAPETEIHEYEVYLYNRWGSTVYYNKNYRNEWDAFELPDGMYFYLINSDTGCSYKGGVSVVR